MIIIWQIALSQYDTQASDQFPLLLSKDGIIEKTDLPDFFSENGPSFPILNFIHPWFEVEAETTNFQ